jgi:hypothetical protein
MDKSIIQIGGWYRNSYAIYDIETNPTLTKKVLKGKHMDNYFKPENFLILDGEKFVKEPWAVLNQVEEFLQVDSTISKDNFEFVEKKGFYCLKISNNSTDCMNQYKGRSKKVYLSDYVKKELRDYYTQHIEKFFNLVKQTVDW